MGFVSKVVPGGLSGVEEEALRMGAVVAGKSPVAVLGTKNILNCESSPTCPIDICRARRRGSRVAEVTPRATYYSLDSRDHS
jgi:hypothetical protein